MKILTLCCLLCLPFGAQAADAPFVLNAEQWAVPRRGGVVVGMPVVSAAMRALDAKPGSHLVIRFPGGDEGSLWASELSAWLVSLGLSSSRIELVPGSHSANTIEMVVRTPISPESDGDS